MVKNMLRWGADEGRFGGFNWAAGDMQLIVRKLIDYLLTGKEGLPETTHLTRANKTPPHFK
jgi:hypothetical protein